jgi:hypothetical protein
MQERARGSVRGRMADSHALRNEGEGWVIFVIRADYSKRQLSCPVRINLHLLFLRLVHIYTKEQRNEGMKKKILVPSCLCFFVINSVFPFVICFYLW